MSAESSPTVDESSAPMGRDILFACPLCRKNLVVADAAAGLTVDCPQCDGQIIVPYGETWWNRYVDRIQQAVEQTAQAVIRIEESAQRHQELMTQWLRTQSPASASSRPVRHVVPTRIELGGRLMSLAHSRSTPEFSQSVLPNADLLAALDKLKRELSDARADNYRISTELARLREQASESTQCSISATTGKTKPTPLTEAPAGRIPLSELIRPLAGSPRPNRRFSAAQRLGVLGIVLALPLLTLFGLKATSRPEAPVPIVCDDRAADATGSLCAPMVEAINADESSMAQRSTADELQNGMGEADTAIAGKQHAETEGKPGESGTKNTQNPQMKILQAILLHEQGRTADAIAMYRQILRDAPQHSVAANNLAEIFATSSDGSLRNGSEALKLARRACELTAFLDPGCLETLAAALAENGRFSEAVTMSKKAHGLAVKSKQRELARQIAMRLYWYSKNLPYRS
jgi:Flp pilus assembly protein TadD